MPHARGAPAAAGAGASASASASDDLGSTDEVKVFKDEGDGDDDKGSSENLLEEKSSLIDLTESEEKSDEAFSSKLAARAEHSPVFGKLEHPPHTGFNMGYLMAPYPYTNGGPHPGLPVSMASKMGLGPAGPGGLPLFCHSGDLSQPPPAHMGIPPPYQLDGKLGLSRPSMYSFPAGTYPYPMLSPEMSQVAASWHTPSMYPISSAASGFRSPYPTSLPITSSSLTSDFYRFSPSLIGPPGHPGLGPPHHLGSLVPPPPSMSSIKSEPESLANHRFRNLEKSSPSGHDKIGSGNASGSNGDGPPSNSSSSADKNKKPHIKKPLNAFMLYMKEMRAKVVAECTLKESAAINQILGRRWHALGREEQAKYYELARRERQLHMQLYPDWSSRANTQRGKKRKRKLETTDGGNNLKKCRARYGLDQQSQWCKPCRRKKKCIRYMEALAAAAAARAGDHQVSIGERRHDDDHEMEDDGSPADRAIEDMSDDSSCSPHDGGESASSPGGLSALSSLTSPSMLLPSPCASMASSLASPAGLHSPLTPLDSEGLALKPPLTPAPIPQSLLLGLNSLGGLNQNLPPLQRHPVGTNPRDVNNPLSVNQLTSQPTHRSSYGNGLSVSGPAGVWRRGDSSNNGDGTGTSNSNKVISVS